MEKKSLLYSSHCTFSVFFLLSWCSKIPSFIISFLLRGLSVTILLGQFNLWQFFAFSTRKMLCSLLLAFRVLDAILWFFSPLAGMLSFLCWHFKIFIFVFSFHKFDYNIKVWLWNLSIDFFDFILFGVQSVPWLCLCLLPNLAQFWSLFHRTYFILTFSLLPVRLQWHRFYIFLLLSHISWRICSFIVYFLFVDQIG